MTNFDRIKSLSLDEMALFLKDCENLICFVHDCSRDGCLSCIRSFLEEDYRDESSWLF